MAAQDLAQQLITQQLFLTPTQQQKLQKYQNEKQMADALQAQGLQPIDTNNRMMGNIAYKISPWEGVAKIAQALGGAYAQKNAREDYGQIMQPDAPAANVSGNGAADNVSGNQPQVNAQGMAGALGGNPLTQMAAQMPPAAQRQYQMDMMAGDTRSATELVTSFYKPTDMMRNASDPRFGSSIIQEQALKASPGQSAMQSAAGTAAAQNAPLGALSGMAGGGYGGQPQPPQQAPQPQINPMSGALMQPSATPPQPASPSAIPNPPPATAFSMPQQGGSAPSIDAVTQALKDQGGGGINISGNAPPDQSGGIGSPPPTNPALNTAQNKAVLDNWQKQQDAKSTKIGDAQGDATVNLAQIKARMPNIYKKLDELSAQADGTSTGIPFVSDDLQQEFLNRTNPKMATANANFEAKGNQLYLQELAPILKALGGKNSVYLDSAIKSGTLVPQSLSAESKKSLINNIKEYMGETVQNAQSLPSQLQGAPANNSGFKYLGIQGK